MVTLPTKCRLAGRGVLVEDVLRESGLFALDLHDAFARTLVSVRFGVRRALLRLSPLDDGVCPAPHEVIPGLIVTRC